MMRRICLVRSCPLKFKIPVLLSVFLCSSFLFAQNHLDRSLIQRLAGDQAFLPTSQTIPLDSAVANFRGEAVSSLTLTAPQRSNRDNLLLLKDKRRSVVKITQSNISQLGDEMQTAISQVVNNNSSTLRDENIQYSQTGLNEFMVFGNFAASREPGMPLEFFVAVIPKNTRFHQVSFQTEWFGGGPGAHNQVRFVFDKPIVAIPQNGDNYVPVIFNHYQGRGDITFTLQAARVQGGDPEWSPIKGLMGEYGVALQIYDTRTLAVEQIQRSVMDDLYIIDVANANSADDVIAMSEKAKSMLQGAIDMADREQELSIYNTVFASCVTYALKVVKMGFPQVSTLWFNPYSAHLRIAALLGNTRLERASMNEAHGESVRSLGGEVMAHELGQSQDAATTQLVRSLNPILQSEEFDRVIHMIAAFIVQENIRVEQVNAFAQGVMNYTGNNLESVAATPEGQQLARQMQELWQREFPGADIAQLIGALQTLRTQNTNPE